jgi:hypothetical protein
MKPPIEAAEEYLTNLVVKTAFSEQDALEVGGASVWLVKLTKLLTSRDAEHEAEKAELRKRLHDAEKGYQVVLDSFRDALGKKRSA